MVAVGTLWLSVCSPFQLQMSVCRVKQNNSTVESFVPFWTPFFLSLPLQHRGRICADGRRRGELQSLLHPSQTWEGPGGGGDHNPPEARNQTRDLGRTRRQQLNAEPSRVAGRGGREGRYRRNWRDGRVEWEYWRISNEGCYWAWWCS